MPGKRWTKEESELLLLYYRDGKSYSEISILLNRGYYGVAEKAVQLGIVINRTWTKEEIEVLVGLIKSGLGCRKMGKVLNRTFQEVNKKCRALGLDTVGRKKMREDENRKIKGIRICPGCKKEFPNTLEFYSRNQSRCKDCSRQYKYAQRHNSLGVLLDIRLSGAKARAKKKDLPCNINLDDLETLWNTQGGKCFYTGIEMTLPKDNVRSKTSISVDRLDPNQGYILENVVLCCWEVNHLKGGKSLDEFYFWCKSIVDNIKEKT